MSFQHLDLSVEEQRNLAIALRTTYNKKDMERLIRSFMKYIHKQAFKFSKKLNDSYFEDLITEGIKAIFAAISTYDESKNDNFFLYAIQRICAEMRVFQKHHISILYMGGVKFHKLFSKMASIAQLSREEQVKSLGINSKEIDTFKMALRPMESEFKTNRNADNSSDEEEHISSNIPNPENIVAFKEVYQLCHKFMENLSEREKVIWMDFLSFESNHAETAKILRLSRERVRQISSLLQQSFKAMLERNGIDSDSCGIFPN